MNNQLGELSKSTIKGSGMLGGLPKLWLAVPITAFGLTLLGFNARHGAFATRSTAVAPLTSQEDDSHRGPIVLISNPDPMAAFNVGQYWTQGTNETELETTVAVNPANHKNIVAIWSAHDWSANAVSVTLDGGATWQIVVIPGISMFAGGTYGSTADPWISFAPDGTLYAANLALPAGSNDIYISKSLDGGLSWGSPALVSGIGVDNPDRPSVTADPGNSNYVYAVWDNGFFGGAATANFTRTTNGGQTWEPPRSIYTAPAGNGVWGPQVMVLPNRTLVYIFTELILTGFNVNSVPQYDYAFSVQRSTDKGQTWSAPIKVAPQRPRIDPDPQDFPWFATATDPDNLHGIAAAGMGNGVAVNPRNGNLYAVWIDARFSGGQYNSIAFSQSTDGGSTWSHPIKVNQTPHNLPTPDHQAFNPTVAVAADGTIGVSYYDLRFEKRGEGCSVDYWLDTCKPTNEDPSTDPDNWGNETRLTNVSFDIQRAAGSTIGGNSSYWLGDYMGLATVGNSFVAAWGQPHAGSPGRILFRKVRP